MVRIHPPPPKILNASAFRIFSSSLFPIPSYPLVRIQDFWREEGKGKREKRETILVNQLLRSGTSIGANIREAFYGHSRADFIAKLQIALKECAESEYWLELLLESGYCTQQAPRSHCVELKKLLIASLNTAKSKQGNSPQVL